MSQPSHSDPEGALAGLATMREGHALRALIAREIVAAGVAESASIAWARRRARPRRDAEPDRWEVALAARAEVPAPVFDLASLTKPLTATVALDLVARGDLAMTTRLSEILPELAGSAAAAATVEELLGHRAGLPDWGALYRSDPWADPAPVSSLPDVPLDRDQILRRAASRCAPAQRGTAVYSCVGYVLLGAMIARITGRPLAESWIDRCAIGSVGRHRRFAERVVPTERDGPRGVVRGAIHDENAHFLALAGGDPGNAGAFATAAEVCAFAIRFVDALAGRGDLLPRETAAATIAERPGGSHRLGWDGRSGDTPSSGAHFGPRTFGHLGFTGTSLWIDPDAEVIAVVLTNRTWPTRDNGAIRVARPRIHDALWAIEFG
jgi:CubicO group peptidase (beta-lactamase class C family)